MKKSFLAAVVFAAVLFCSVAIAGIDNPVLLIGGSIRAGTVPVVRTYKAFDRFDFAFVNLDSKTKHDRDNYSFSYDAKSGDFVHDDIQVFPRHWASKPVVEGRTPTEKDGLLNSGQPICVVADEDTVTFHLDYYNYNGTGVYDKLRLRVFDLNGKIIGTVTEKDNPEGEPLRVKLPGRTQQYYIEIYDPKIPYGSRKIEERYCYILVEVERGKQKPQFGQGSSALSHPWSRNSPEELKKLTQEIEKYEKQHGSVKGYDAFRVIVDNTNKALGYKAFDIEDIMTNAPQRPQEKTKAAPAKKSVKTKRTKKSK